MDKRKSVGNLGEDIAERFLKKHGYTILERNYRKGYGEIDIVAEDDNTVVFVEVKTVSREIGSKFSRETYRPEENVHPQKLKKVIWTAKNYILEKRVDRDWRIDVIAIELDKDGKKANIRHLKGVS